MITQYNGNNGSISADIQNLVANNVSLLDKYILMQTGENEYTALVYNVCSKKCEEITIRRTSSGYSNQFVVERENVQGFNYTVTNEYYVYSNDGIGKSLTLPSHAGATSWAVTIVAVFIMFAVIFKGALFKCLKLKR